MRRRLSNLIDSIAASHSKADLEVAFHQFSHSIKVQHFTFLATNTEKVDFVSTYPKLYQAEYIREGYSRFDPVMAIAKRAHAPFSWSCDTFRLPSSNEAKVIDAAVGFGLRAGNSIPVELPYGTFAILTFVTDEVFDFGRYISPLTIAMCLAQCVLAREERSVGVPGAINLTMRQVQCLLWASHGKSAKETACILGISEDAVTFHRKKARERLKAKSVSEAIRRACDMSLLP